MLLRKATTGAKLVMRLFTAVLPLPGATRFTIISRGRSGSTLLVSLLDSHPRIRVQGAVLGEGALGQPLLKKMIVKLGPVSYVRRCFKRVGLESAVGIKVLYYHVGKRYGQRWGVDGLPDVVEFLKSQRDIRILHLKRRNRLKSFTSMRVAADTGKYLGTSDAKDRTAKSDSVRIRLTPDECEEEFRQIGRWEKYFDDAFQDHKILEVYYEDLVAERQAECDRILDFLGVSRRSLTTRMTKQRKSTLSEVIENYDDLRRYFADTEWAGYFAE